MATGVVRRAGALVLFDATSVDVGTVGTPLEAYGILEAYRQLGFAQRLGTRHRPLALIARRPPSALTMSHGRYVCSPSILGATLAIDVVRRAGRFCFLLRRVQGWERHSLILKGDLT